MEEKRSSEEERQRGGEKVRGSSCSKETGKYYTIHFLYCLSFTGVGEARILSQRTWGTRRGTPLGEVAIHCRADHVHIALFGLGEVVA